MNSNVNNSATYLRGWICQGHYIDGRIFEPWIGVEDFVGDLNRYNRPVLVKVANGKVDIGDINDDIAEICHNKCIWLHPHLVGFKVGAYDFIVMAVDRVCSDDDINTWSNVTINFITKRDNKYELVAD